jgi:hypothetical protein
VQVRFLTIYTHKKVSGFIYLWFLFGDWNKSGVWWTPKSKTNAMSVILVVIAGVTLYGGERAVQLLKLPKATSFHTEYSALACTVEIVKDIDAAIEHIHDHGRWFIELC